MGNSGQDSDRHPHIHQQPLAQAWLQFQAIRLSDNTVSAYGNALEDFLAFCARLEINPTTARRDHILLYIRDLSKRPLPSGYRQRRVQTETGYALASQKQRLTAIRLFFDFLIEENVRDTNPVGRGHYAPGSPAQGKRGLVPTVQHLPWIPTDKEWRSLLNVAQHKSIRLRYMLALGYDTGLRRQELCALEIRDIDPAFRSIHVRAETTKGKRGRVVIYSPITDELFHRYLAHRRHISRDGGALFLSESPRNHGQPLSYETWSKEIRKLRDEAGLIHFTPHTLRHLCLTDLARSGWDLHEIAAFAGHRSIQSTLVYIHLSGRDIASKLQQGMDEIHAWRTREMMRWFNHDD